MKTYFLALCALLFATCSMVNLPDGHGGTGHDDSNTVNSLSSVNPASGTYGDQSYPSQVYDSLSKEDANRWAEEGFPNFVSTTANASACLGVTGAGLTMTPTACVAYNAGYRGTEIGSITFANSKTTWVAMDENTSGNNANLPNFTRVTGTHYLTDAIDTSQPTMASDSQLLMEVITSGGAITIVSDLRHTSALPSTATFTSLTTTNLTAGPGAISITGNSGNGTDTISGVCINGVCPLSDFYGECTGTASPVAPTTGDTTANDTVIRNVASVTGYKVGGGIDIQHQGTNHSLSAPSLTVTAVQKVSAENHVVGSGGLVTFNTGSNWVANYSVQYAVSGESLRENTSSAVDGQYYVTPPVSFPGVATYNLSTLNSPASLRSSNTSYWTPDTTDGTTICIDARWLMANGYNSPAKGGTGTCTTTAAATLSKTKGVAIRWDTSPPSGAIAIEIYKSLDSGVTWARYWAKPLSDTTDPTVNYWVDQGPALSASWTSSIVDDQFPAQPDTNGYRDDLVTTITAIDSVAKTITVASAPATTLTGVELKTNDEMALENAVIAAKVKKYPVFAESGCRIRDFNSTSHPLAYASTTEIKLESVNYRFGAGPTTFYIDGPGNGGCTDNTSGALALKFLATSIEGIQLSAVDSGSTNYEVDCLYNNLATSHSLEANHIGTAGNSPNATIYVTSNNTNKLSSFQFDAGKRAMVAAGNVLHAEYGEVGRSFQPRFPAVQINSANELTLDNVQWETDINDLVIDASTAGNGGCLINNPYFSDMSTSSTVDYGDGITIQIGSRSNTAVRGCRIKGGLLTSNTTNGTAEAVLSGDVALDGVTWGGANTGIIIQDSTGAASFRSNRIKIGSGQYSALNTAIVDKATAGSVVLEPTNFNNTTNSIDLSAATDAGHLTYLSSGDFSASGIVGGPLCAGIPTGWEAEIQTPGSLPTFCGGAFKGTNVTDSALPSATCISTDSNGLLTPGCSGAAVATLQLTIANAGVTGTTTSKLTKLTGAPSTGVVTGAGDTSGAIGICTSGCGTTSNGVIALSGSSTCVFDGATTAGHYAQISASVAGDCTDAGATYPATGQVIGRVLSTNGGAGTYAIDLFDEIQGKNPFVGFSGPTAARTYALPDSSTTLLNTATAPDAGTRTATSGRYPKGDGTNWNTSSGSASGTGTCTNQFVSATNSDAAPTCTTDTLASAQHANQGTTTTVLHGNAAGNPSWAAVTSSDVDSTVAVTGTGGSAQILASKQNIHKYTTISPSATPAVDFSAASDNIITMTTAQNESPTFTMPTLAANEDVWLVLRLCQPASGTLDSVTWPTVGGQAIRWAGGSVPNVTQSLGVGDTFTFDYDGTNTYGYQNANHTCP